MYPKRQIKDETALVSQVQQTLGNKYIITVVDFALGISDADRIASQSNAIVGVHCAGLVWSSFLNDIMVVSWKKALYHNIASLDDLHYRSLNMKVGSSKSLNWDSGIVNMRLSRTFHEEPGVKDKDKA